MRIYFTLIVLLFASIAMPLAAVDRLADSMDPILKPFAGYLDKLDAQQAGYLENQLEMKPPLDSKKFPNFSVRREYRTRIRDFDVAVYDRILSDGTWSDLILIINWNSSVADLSLQREMFEVVSEYFGKPTKVVDCGFSPRPQSKGFSLSSVQAEWRKGSRRLLFISENMIGSFGTPMPLYASLQVSEAREDLVDLAYLKMTIKSLVDPLDRTETAYAGDPFVIIADLNSKRLLGTSWTLIGTIIDLSPGKVVSTWGSKDSGNTISLDRYAGTFSLELINSKYPGGKQKANGIYERIEPEKVKLF